MDDHYQYSRPRPKLICRSSVQLDQMLMLPSSADSDLDSVPPGSQLYQIKERAYMQRLQVFQEAQQRQAQLVQKLQTKVRTSGLCQDVMKSCDLASLAVFCFFSVLPQGPAVQEEVWRVGGTSPREDLQGREDATDGRSSLDSIPCFMGVEEFQRQVLENTVCCCLRVQQYTSIVCAPLFVQLVGQEFEEQHSKERHGRE